MTIILHLLVTTEMTWDYLVLKQTALKEIDDIRSWLNHHNELAKLWDNGKRIRPGYKALFYGPPGTGKTLAATLLGQTCDMEVYRIDLSQIVSKYIGETEKNLERVFAKAANKNWILFIDEADALFGKRTSISNAHNRYANQEVSYLLQRIEEYDGLVILATNLKSNIDSAFTRRFQAIIHFSMPAYEERLRLWQNSISQNFEQQPGINLAELARKYKLSGSGIVNAIHYAKLQALAQRKGIEKPKLTPEALMEGIRREYQKGDKIL